MLELKDDRDIMGKDVFLNGQRIGWVSFGDLRAAHADRRPVTMLNTERGTRYHESFDAAVKFIEQETGQALEKETGGRL